MQKKSKEFKLFAVITAISTFLTIGGSFLAPIEVRFINTLTQSNTLIGLTFSVGTIFFVIFAFIVGRLSVKYGKRRLITTGILLSVIYPILYASSINVFQYMGVKVAAAFAGAAAGPLLGALLQDSINKSKSKGKFLGIYHSIQSIAGSTGSILGGYLSDAYSLKMPYFAESAVFIIPAILAICFIGFKKPNPGALDEEKHEKRSIFFSVSYIIKRPYLVYNLMLNAIFTLNWHMRGIIYPLALYSMTSSNTITGTVFATMGFTAMIILPFAGHFVDKKGYLKGFYITYVVMSIANVIIALAAEYQSIAWFFISASMIAFGESFNGPSRGVLEIENIEDRYRGEILGFMYSYSAVIAALTAIFAGIMLNYFSYSGILFIYAAITASGFMGAIIVLRHMKKAVGA